MTAFDCSQSARSAVCEAPNCDIFPTIAAPRKRDRPERYKRARPSVAMAEAVQRPEFGDGMITARALDGYRDLVSRHGADGDSFLHLCGLSDDTLEPSIPFQNFAALLEMTAEVTGCPDFGMQLSDEQYWSELVGPLAVLVESADRFSATAESFAKNIHVFSTAFHATFERFGNSGDNAFRFDILSDDVPLRRQVVEYMLATCHRGKIELARPAERSREVWFSHAPVANGSTYQRRFRATVRFCMPFNGIFFTCRDTGSPVDASDPASPHADVRKFALGRPAIWKLSLEVKRIINLTLDVNACSRDLVAAALDIHPRTLHRRLRREGQTFETIRDQVRRDLAAYYLIQSNLSVTEVGARLGYSEPAVLTHACRRWFGNAPTLARYALAAQASARHFDALKATGRNNEKGNVPSAIHRAAAG